MTLVMFRAAKRRHPARTHDEGALHRASRRGTQLGASVAVNTANVVSRGTRFLAVAIDPKVKGYLRRAIIVVGVGVIAVIGWTGYQLWSAWHNVERVPFDVESARDNLTTTTIAGLPEDDPDSPIIEGDLVDDPGVAGATAFIPNESLNAFLVIGSDQREEAGPSRRADVILLFLLPADGGNPVLMSIPRDLYIANPCTGAKSRINANLNGCGDQATGPEQLAIAVEDFTGIPIDHFAVFDFEGFKNIIDRVGGVEICVQNPVMDTKVTPVPLDLSAGCSIAGGDQALAWMRSRHTQQFVNGSWSTVPGVNDLTRNQRQQDLIIQALTRLEDFNSITELTNLVEDVSDEFTIDSGLGLGEAIAFAWDLRSLDLSTVVRPVIPVANYEAPGGAFVLIPTSSFRDVLVEADPGAASMFTETGS